MDQGKSSFECYERGLVLKRVQMFQQAIENFQQAARHPQYAGQANVQVALCYRAVGSHEEAVAAFRKALESPALSIEEKRHILYHIGQTLESLGRYAESLAVYGVIRKDNPQFRDVTQRIKRLCAGGRESASQSQGVWPAWMDEVFMRGRQWLSWQAGTVTGPRMLERKSSDCGDGVSRIPQPVAMSKKRPAGRERTVNTRRHTRVPVRLRGQFSAEGRMVGGEGELRDLSPWGCRMTSAVAVPVGAQVQCCIFPKGRGNPYIIEGATVRWISRQEFGLAFTKVHPGVQQQIAQLCRAQAA
jgi:tetratricopeptide (TPR) repeat protein